MATKTPRTGRPIESYEENFWSKVQWPSEPDGCWQWTGARNWSGYGIFFVHNRRMNVQKRAHQWAMQFYGENINPGDNLHHVCQNKLCVNPDHLEILSHADHSRIQHTETCKRGHLRSENLWFRGNGEVGHCKECQKIRVLERKAGG